MHDPLVPSLDLAGTYLLDWQSYSLVGPKGALDLRSQCNTGGLI
jgi:hypothetical protein